MKPVCGGCLLFLFSAAATSVSAVSPHTYIHTYIIYNVYVQANTVSSTNNGSRSSAIR